MRSILMVLTLTPCVSACAGLGTAVNAASSAAALTAAYLNRQPVSVDCVFAEPIYLNDAAVDAADYETLLAIAEHNEKVTRACGPGGVVAH